MEASPTPESTYPCKKASSFSRLSSGEAAPMPFSSS